MRSWVDSAVYSDVGYQRLRDATLLHFSDARDLRLFVGANSSCCVALGGGEYILDNAYQP